MVEELWLVDFGRLVHRLGAVDAAVSRRVGFVVRTLLDL